MDKVTQVATMANTEVIKEPRGFIKFIQVILAIFAFATTTAYVGHTTFHVTCNVTTSSVDQPPSELICSYPFRLDQSTYTSYWCNSSSPMTKSLYGNYGSSAEFYVFVGVTAFLYTLGALVLYIFFDDKYRQMEVIPIVDFVTTAVYVLLWLISSAAWADAVVHIKHYMSPKSYTDVNDCRDPNSCTVTDGGNYATLDVSIIFGFLNMCVWGGNLWFLYKETKWHKSNELPPVQNLPPGSDPQQRI